MNEVADDKPNDPITWTYRDWMHKMDGFQEGACVDRARFVRQEHSPDKDGRCVFCDKAVAD